MVKLVAEDEGESRGEERPRQAKRWKWAIGVVLGKGLHGPRGPVQFGVWMRKR